MNLARLVPGKYNRLVRYVFYLAALLTWGAAGVAEESGGRVAVLYPELRQPFEKIFLDMVEGIRSTSSGEISVFPVSDGDTRELAGTLRTSRFDAIVALGHRSVELLEQEKPDVPVIIGGVTSPPDSLVASGYLMKAGAAAYLIALQSICPKVKRVFVVYRNGRNHGLVKEAIAEGINYNIQVVAFQADNIRESAAAYRRLLGDANGGDAVWILSDSRLIDGSLLSLVLKEAWKKNLMVFSSNPLDVKRGALFAIYPDNRGIGRSLGLLANAVLAGELEAGEYRPLKDFGLAINNRTSDHLGLRLSPEVRARVDLYFPDG